MNTECEVKEAVFNAVVEPTASLPHFQKATVRIQSNSTEATSLLALNNALVFADRESRAARTVKNVKSNPSVETTTPLLKRALDIAVSIFILIILLLPLAVCAALVRISSPGPIFFRHRRIGLGGKQFFVWKFRTMYQNADQILEEHLRKCPDAKIEWLQRQKLSNDPRVTSIGRFMRRFSIDEFPQLWNVIIGDMSLIGPRPIVQAEVHRYGEAIASYYAVRPGMTGLWQVSGRSNTSYLERVRMDEQYAKKWSLALDALIFLRTFHVLLSGEGAY
jgi:lipopolysaccharide/colanic/teichoic acid biosynthesis glycosyltransferase